jgi:hypothetical protein
LSDAIAGRSLYFDDCPARLQKSHEGFIF